MPTATKQVDDPNAHIPPAVRAAAKAAEEAHKKVYKKPDEPAPTPDPAPAPTPASDPAPTPAPDPAPAPAPAPVVLSGNNEPIDWERRYKSMEGRYKRAENDIRAMSDQIASMQSLLANVQAVPEPLSPDLNPKSLLTPEEVNEYGEEFLGVVAKKAKEELTPEVAELKRELAKINKRLEGSQQASAATARAQLEATLDQQVPSWRDVNVAPEFHSWLALPDLYSGAIRHQLLTAAYEQNNTPRVLAFFKGFLSEEAATAPRTDPAPADPQSSKIPLENFAAPGRAKTAAAPSSVPAEKPVFTRAEIAKFYADSAAGKFRGKEAEKNRIEGLIFEAERDGRIR